MTMRALLSTALVLCLGLPAAGQVADESSVARISAADLKKAADAGQVLIVDVRDPRSYAAGHIPGSVNVTLDALPQKVAVLKGAKKAIVTYCSWGAEATSARAALDLDRLGVKGVKALKGGTQAWINAGYPLATGVK